MPDTPLNLGDSHRNTLLAGAIYIDRLLSDALAGLTTTGDGAIFAPTLPDATAMQRKVIADQAGRLRQALRTALDAWAIPVRPPSLSALWSLRTTLDFIDITVEDLGPEHLRGYGTIDDATAAGVAALQAQIRTIVRELQSYLEAGLGGDLSARLARLDQTRDEVRLLRELERIITNHGLVALRQPLTRLLERLEKNWWTVAFVGRVSCGKSSLLNYLLSTEVLPCGVTPVTAVPIRIVAGATSIVTVAFATGKPERFPAGHIAAFASEEQNPGNARHVTDILLELPAVRLAGDVCFVDTPGLGSLATAGAAQTLAFLPRCDAGVLLIDAANTPGEEDLAVARALAEDGAEVMVVISKADLLNEADRGKLHAYVARHFAQALGRTIPVAVVSVVPGQTGLTETWWREALGPLEARHRELAALTLRRKIGALREAVVATLARRTGSAPLPKAAAGAATVGAVRASLDDTGRRVYDLAFEATPTAEAVLQGVARVLAAQEPPPDLAAAVARELGGAAAQLADKFETRLQGARAAAEHALEAAGEAAQFVDLPRPASRPLFDPAPVLAAGPLSTSWQRWPGLTARRAALRRHLQSRLAGALDEALRSYAHALVGWSRLFLDDLTAQFNAQAGFIEARTAPATVAPASPQLTCDLKLLRSWNTTPVA